MLYIPSLIIEEAKRLYYFAIANLEKDYEMDMQSFYHQIQLRRDAYEYDRQRLHAAFVYDMGGVNDG